MKAKVNLFSTIIFIMMAMSAKSQTISGRLADQADNKPLASATVTLKDSTDKIIKTLSLKDGSFAFKAIKQGSYLLECSQMGYQTHSQKVQIQETTEFKLGLIQMTSEAKNLQEISITATKPSLQLLPDKKVFEVGKDVLSQNGSLSDVLNGLPSVNVSPQGQVSLRGNPGVVVLVNGRRSGLVQGNGLEQLQAAMIDRIEVITSPSARYDASGSAGIINIILKKQKKDGFNAQVQLMAGAPNDSRINPSLNYRSDRFTFFSTFGLRKSDYKGLYSSEQNTASSALLMQHREQRHDDGKMLYTGIDYQLSEKRTMTAAFLWNGTKDHDKSHLGYDYQSHSPDSSLLREAESWESRNYHQLEYNYTQTFQKPKQKWTIDLQYDWWDSRKDWQLETRKVFPLPATSPAIRTATDEANRDLLVQSDWVQPINKEMELEVGLKAEHRKVDYDFLAQQQNGSEYTLYQGMQNQMRYAEAIQGAYTQLGGKIGKWSYLAGLRAELTKVGIASGTFEASKRYIWAFPTAHLNYVLDEQNTLQVHYSTRINRPSLYSLAPYATLVDLSFRETGNPDLNPAYTHIFELGMLHRTAKFTINPTLFFQKINSPLNDYTYRDSEGILIAMPINLQSESRAGIELNVSWNPASFLQLSADFNIYRFNQQGQYNGFDFAHKGGASGGRLNSVVKLPAAWSLQGRYYYNGANSNAQSKTLAMHWVDLGLGKKLFKERLTFAMDATNVFDTRRYRTIVTGADYQLTSMSRFNGARCRLSVTYKIGKDAQARQAKSGNRN